MARTYVTAIGSTRVHLCFGRLISLDGHFFNSSILSSRFKTDASRFDSFLHVLVVFLLMMIEQAVGLFACFKCLYGNGPLNF